MTLLGMVRVAVAAALMMVAGSPAFAQDDFPNRPITFVVPFPAGGGSDAMARVLAAALAKELGQSVVVENQPGGGTMIATQTVVSAQPDGYTMLFATDSLPANIALRGSDMPYDALKDLQPISLYSMRSNVLLAKTGLGVKTLQELIDLAKQKPGELTVGSSGIATGGHFAIELLQKEAGIKLVHVPYGGAAPALVDLLGGRIDLLTVASESAFPHIQSGAAVPLGVTTSRRSTSLLPDVPTIGELIPGFEVSIWNGIMVPAGTPESVVAKLNKAVNQAVCCNADVIERLKTADALANAGTPEAMAQYINDEIARLKPIIESAGIKAP